MTLPADAQAQYSNLRRDCTTSSGSTRPDHLLRIDEVCGRVGLSRSTVNRLEKRGAFPGRLQVTDCAVRWRESAVAAWIDARRQAA